MKRLRALGALLLLHSSLCVAAAIVDPLASVTLKEEKNSQGDLYHIEGHFEVEAPRRLVWGVLTDYSALKGVVSSMQASCVLSREGNTVQVEQVALGRFLFFHKSIRLLLTVEEKPESSLSFTETSGKPFRRYEGSWDLEDKAGAVAVTYRLDVSQADMAPPFVERGLFKDNALSLLKELRTEILRRATLESPLKTKKAP